MTILGVLNAAAMKKVASRSPHPPKTDKFSKVDQERKTEPEVKQTAVVSGAKISDKIPTSTGTQLTAKIDSTTGQRTLNGRVLNFDNTSAKTFIDNVLAASTGDGGVQQFPSTNYENYDETNSPPADTSGYKSATNPEGI